MGQPSSYLIIGNGITGVTAAETLRSEDPTSVITIVADDPFPVYYRPALKAFLSGRISEEKLWARPTNFYQEQRIRFIPGRVVSLNPTLHQVLLQDGRSINYDKLLVASGARPRRLNCPGLDLAGVSTLRTIADYKEIQRRLQNTSRVVVCGSGILALETVETLRKMDYQVTHLLNRRKLWSNVLDTTASDLVLQEEQRAGVDIYTEETIQEIVGRRGQVTKIITTRGKSIPCDQVLIAIGIEPTTDFLKDSGIARERGIKVNRRMGTSAPDVYAAGDVIETTYGITGDTRVIGQWYPAIQQARIAAYSMLGLNDKIESYNPDTLYNATPLYGFDFVSVGLTRYRSEQKDIQKLVAPAKARSYSKILLKDGQPLGILFLGERQNALAFKRAIDHHVNLKSILDRLFLEDFDLDTWLNEQDVPQVFSTIPPQQPTGATRSHGYLVPVPHPQVKIDLSAFRIQKQGTLIGRTEGATLVIDHSSISRRHAAIIYTNGKYVLRDVGSANGTFVNNTRLTPDRVHSLQPNDLIRLGDIQYSFQLRKEDTNTTDSLWGSSQLHTSATRIIPEQVLARLPATPTLILVTRDAEPRTIALEADKRYTLGRDQQCTIVLKDTAASRTHAELFSAADGFYIRDMESSNGVFINKVKINNAYHLTHSDRIVIGNTLIYCSFPQLASATPADKPEKLPIVVGLRHRSNIQALDKGHLRFEIDMCIGCDLCMEACPIPMSSTINIADLNHATVGNKIAPSIARFTSECIMCGSCVPVCPVDDHRDLLMLSLKQRVGVSWDSPPDMARVGDVLPIGWNIARLTSRLREQPMLSDTNLVPGNYLLHIAAASRLLALESDATIIREGEYGRDLYFILEGQVTVASTDIKGQELQTAILSRGEYVGEYGLLTGQPHNTTARTQTPTLVLQVPEQVIQQLTELVPKAQNFFEQLNNTRSVKGIIKSMALFQGISDTDISTLVEQTQIKQHERNDRLFAEDDRGDGKRPSRETLHIILEGFVKVARRTAEQNKTNERIIAYRQAGDYFVGGLDQKGDGKAVTVTAMTRTRVAEVPRSAVLDMFQRYPDVKQRFALRLREYVESDKNAYSMVFSSSLVEQKPQSDPAARVGLDSLVRDGIVEGTDVLLIDLDKCIHCNECEEACTRRHGHSRMNRKGIVVGNISIATTCRHCQDPVCMLCSRAGIGRLPNGEVYITENCIGCGICAERCPYGAISIVNVAGEAAITQRSWQQFNSQIGKGTNKKPKRAPLPVISSDDAYEEMRKKVAIKCDLCAGYKDQACVQACPTGAAIRVQPTKFFGTTEEILHQRSN